MTATSKIILAAAMPFVFVLVIVVLTTRTMNSTANPLSPNDECPPAMSISTSYTVIKGQVLEAVDGQTLTVKVFQDGKPHNVRLVGTASPPVDTKQGIASKNNLDKLARNKNIEIWLMGTEPWKSTVSDVTGKVLIPQSDWQDIGLEQIQAGMARRYEFGAYSIDARDSCLYTAAEIRARAAGVGIWAD